MCIVVLHWQPDSDVSLQVWANRDEFRARPALPTAFWPAAPTVLAGQDVQAGGTWMGVTRQRRFAAITNYRSPLQAGGQRSRGALVADFLRGDETAETYVHRVAAMGDAYTGFSLLVSDGQRLCYVSNRDEQPYRRLAPGWHGVSNGLLDSPWPKLARLRSLAAAQVTETDADRQLAILADTMPADEAQLPDTGVGLAMERLLSPICIPGEHYGTRNSTWLRIDRAGIRWEERLWPDGKRLSFRCANAPG